MKKLWRRRKGISNNKGMSLVELLASIAILVIIVVPLLNAFVLSTKTNARARHRLRANDVGKNVMESFNNASLDTSLTTIDMDGNTDPDRPVKYYELRNQMSDGGLYDILLKVDYNPDDAENKFDENVYETVNQAPVIDLSPIDSRFDAVSELIRTPNSDLERIGATYGVALTTENTSRTITVDIEPVNTYVKVVLSYSYSFMDSRGRMVTYPNETSSDADSYSDTMYYQDQSDYALKNIYVFFKPWYTDGYHGLGASKDHFVIQNRAEQEINVLLVKQKMDIGGLRVAEERYSAEVSVTDVMKSGGVNGYIRIKTNLGTNMDSGSATMNTQAFYKINNYDVSGTINNYFSDPITGKKLFVSDLVTLAADRRLYDVTVYVYQRKDAGTDVDFKTAKPIATITGGMTE